MDQPLQMRNHILDMIADAKEQRFRPIELKRILENKYQYSMFSVQKTLNDMVRNGDLIFTYRDPCNYVEIPMDQQRERLDWEI